MYLGSFRMFRTRFLDVAMMLYASVFLRPSLSVCMSVALSISLSFPSGQNWTNDVPIRLARLNSRHLCVSLVENHLYTFLSLSCHST